MSLICLRQDKPFFCKKFLPLHQSSDSNQYKRRPKEHVGTFSTHGLLGQLHGAGQVQPGADTGVKFDKKPGSGVVMHQPLGQNQGRCASVVSAVLNRQIAGVVSAHAITTLHYLMAKYANKAQANSLVDWLLAHFEISAIDTVTLIAARQLPFSDFEDAVVAAAARNAGCAVIITRNTADFSGSPVPAEEPTAFLQQLAVGTKVI